jgi:hypothetical protein
MGVSIYPALEKLAHLVAMPVYTHFFLNASVGREYGLRRADRVRLLRRIHRNATCITSGTSWLEQLLLASYVLSLPKALQGDVVECGCFKGSSTASLSLVCEATGRRLIVCDSFEGLPEIGAEDKRHVSLHHQRYEEYSKGEYKAALEEVRENIRRHGALDRCTFVKGYFEHTLPSLDCAPVFVFLDVDLHASLRTCLLNLWPRLAEGGYLFTHEAQQLDYVRIFFDREWWRENLRFEAPGLVGAGCGLPAGLGAGTGLGYALKLGPGFSVSDDPRFKLFCGEPRVG